MTESEVTVPLDLAAEAARMTWAGQFHPVPEVLDHGADYYRLLWDLSS